MDNVTNGHNSTMEELYKIKARQSLRRINMTTEELIADIKEGAKEGYEILENLKQEKELIAK